jgi:hypothetical protein
MSVELDSLLTLAHLVEQSGHTGALLDGKSGV